MSNGQTSVYRLQRPFPRELRDDARSKELGDYPSRIPCRVLLRCGNPIRQSITRRIRHEKILPTSGFWLCCVKSNKQKLASRLRSTCGVFQRGFGESRSRRLLAEAAGHCNPLVQPYHQLSRQLAPADGLVSPSGSMRAGVRLARGRPGAPRCWAAGSGRPRSSCHDGAIRDNTSPATASSL
jgi:hypothetical protein